MRNYNNFCRLLTHFLLKHILYGFMILLVMRNSGSSGLLSNTSVPESHTDTQRFSVNPLPSVIDQKPAILINESKDNPETELYQHLTDDRQDLEKSELEETPHITDDAMSFAGKSTLQLNKVSSKTVPLSTKNTLDHYSNTASAVDVSAGITETANPFVIDFTEHTNLTRSSSTYSSHVTNLRHDSTAHESVDMHLESSGEEIQTALTNTGAETSGYPSDGSNAETLELYYSSINDSGDPVAETSTIRLSENQTHDFVPNYSGSNFVADVQSVFSEGRSIVSVNTAAVSSVNVSDSGVPKERTGSRALLDVTDACPSGHRQDAEGRCRALFGPSTRPAQGAPTSDLEDLEHNSFWSLDDIIKWFIYQYG